VAQGRPAFGIALPGLGVIKGNKEDKEDQKKQRGCSQPASSAHARAPARTRPPFLDSDRLWLRLPLGTEYPTPRWERHVERRPASQPAQPYTLLGLTEMACCDRHTQMAVFGDIDRHCWCALLVRRWCFVGVLRCPGGLIGLEPIIGSTRKIRYGGIRISWYFVHVREHVLPGHRIHHPSSQPSGVRDDRQPASEPGKTP
jgi:hypothetical protein